MDKTTTLMIRAACGVVLAVPVLLILGWIGDTVFVQPRQQMEQRYREKQRALKRGQYACVSNAVQALELVDSGISGLTRAEAEQALQECCDALKGYHAGCDSEGD